MVHHLKTASEKLKKELLIYRAVSKDPRTPLISRILLWLSVGYLLLPFDLIPDWIPVLGQVDDIILVPVLVILAMRSVPNEIVAEHREEAGRVTPGCIVISSKGNRSLVRPFP